MMSPGDKALKGLSSFRHQLRLWRFPLFLDRAIYPSS